MCCLIRKSAIVVRRGLSTVLRYVTGRHGAFPCADRLPRKWIANISRTRQWNELKTIPTMPCNAAYHPPPRVLHPRAITRHPVEVCKTAWREIVTVEIMLLRILFSRLKRLQREIAPLWINVLIAAFCRLLECYWLLNCTSRRYLYEKLDRNSNNTIFSSHK